MGVTPRLLIHLVYHIFSGVTTWLYCGLLASAVSELSPGGSVGFLGACESPHSWFCRRKEAP